MIKTKNLDKNEIIDLYINKNLSCIKIAKIYGCNPSTIRVYLKKLEIPRRTLSEAAKEFTFDEDFFEKIDTEEKAYWLGFLYADGCINNRQSKLCRTIQYTIKLTLAEIEPVEAFKKSLKSDYKISVQKVISKKGKNLVNYSLTITSEKMFNDLINLGCVLNKTHILKFPTENQVPKDLQRHFIRGYFDGDGSIMRNICRQKRGEATFCYTRPKVQFCGTLEFLNSVKKLLNIERKLFKESRNNSRTWYLNQDSYPQVYRIYNFMYENSTIYLQRKKEKFHELFKERGSTTIIGTPIYGLYHRGVRDSLILHENVS